MNTAALRTARKHRKNCKAALRRALKPLAGSIAALLLLGTTHRGFAGSATWTLNPGTGDWNTAGNWTPATVPNNPPHPHGCGDLCHVEHHRRLGVCEHDDS